jgi:uncharacterized membrane protein HdeD (DUF308 family)
MAEEKGFVQQLCSDVWWLVLLRGTALVILGGYLLYRPGITVMLLLQFLGAYFFVDGIFSIANSIMGRKYMQGWGWGIFMGIMEILAGIIVFARPLASTVFTTGFLVYMIAFGAMFFGVLGLVTGILVRKEIKGEWSMIVGGLLAIVLGVLMLANPEASVLALIITLGSFALVGGFIQVFIAFRLRKIGKKGIEAVA